MARVVLPFPKHQGTARTASNVCAHVYAARGSTVRPDTELKASTLWRDCRPLLSSSAFLTQLALVELGSTLQQVRTRRFAQRTIHASNGPLFGRLQANGLDLVPLRERPIFFATLARAGFYLAKLHKMHHLYLRTDSLLSLRASAPSIKLNWHRRFLNSQCTHQTFWTERAS